MLSGLGGMVAQGRPAERPVLRPLPAAGVASHAFPATPLPAMRRCTCPACGALLQMPSHQHLCLCCLAALGQPTAHCTQTEQGATEGWLSWRPCLQAWLWAQAVP